MAYLLDTNVFVEAKKRHYGFDFCPAFWEWLSLANENGTVFSIEQVLGEILRREDELTEWATARSDDFFLVSTGESSAVHARVCSWASARHYSRAAVNEFAAVADSYLVAHAVAAGYKVVTQEISGGSRKRVKIPDACAGFGVEWLTPFEMLSREGARFVLDRAA